MPEVGEELAAAILPNNVPVHIFLKRTLKFKNGLKSNRQNVEFWHFHKLGFIFQILSFAPIFCSTLFHLTTSSAHTKYERMCYYSSM